MVKLSSVENYVSGLEDIKSSRNPKYVRCISSNDENVSLIFLPQMHYLSLLGCAFHQCCFHHLKE